MQELLPYLYCLLINERVARLSAAIPKLEGDNKDMEEDNIDMEEVLTYRKRPYRCVKRPETTDTENSSEEESLLYFGLLPHVGILSSSISILSSSLGTAANNLATLSLIFAR
jgi:hypothetical protein